MAAKLTCPKCGATLRDDAPQGLCPICLVRMGRDLVAGGAPVQPALPPPPSALDLPRSFGHFELLEEIARGGMGVVFKARQRSLNRTVAVKMILAGQLASEADVQRFRAEAESAARLQHPNIVAIHEVGEHDGHHFFSMDYVQGRHLGELVRDGPLPAARAARYVQTVAEAIYYAHRQGILHRDLKPANILIDAEDQPRVTDFGLAKLLHRDSTLTVTGQVLGSPNFMPPEQASGRRGEVGPPSDVYSLGAILYHLLTGRPPFAAATLESTVALVLNTDAVSPRLLNPGVPRDLETICLKCLEKEPAQRYQTAQEFAEELGRFLRHEPILARSVTAPEKFWRWTRRKPALASLSASVLVLIALGFAGVLWQLQRAKVKSEQDRQRLVRLNVAAGARLMDEGDLLGSLPWFTKALQLDRGHAAAEQIHRLRLGTLLSQCPRLLAVMVHDGVVNHAEFSPDGRWIVSGSRDQTGRVWDALTGEPLSPPLQHGSEVKRAAFSPDGRRVLTAGGKTVRIWDALTGQPLTLALAHRQEVIHAAFSPDGKRLLCVSSERFESGEVYVWDAVTGQALLPPLKHDRDVQHAAFSPDGSTIATASGNIDKPGSVQLWDADTGAPIGEPMNPSSPVWRVAFSADGQRILSAAGDHQLPGAAQVWDARLRKPVALPMKHSAQVSEASFSPDGGHVVTASMDNTARVWDARSGEPITPPLKHAAWVTHVAFSPDGRFVVTSSRDLTARIWRVDTGDPFGPPLRHLGVVSMAQFSPDGLRLLTTSQDQLVRVWDVMTAEPASKLLPHGALVRRVAFSPDGTSLVTGAGGGQCRMWGVPSGQLIREFRQHTIAVDVVMFSPDGRRLLTGSMDGTAQLWDPVTGQPTTPPLHHSNMVLSGAFSPDGQRVVTGSADRTARIWSAADGHPLTPPLAHSGAVWEAIFSPDGRQLLTTIDTDPTEPSVCLWDGRAGTPLTHLIHHRDEVMTASYSPDGRHIVTGSSDQTARVWDATTGRPVTRPLRHNGPLIVACVSPDGRRVLTGGEDNTARLWDAETGQPLTPPMKHGHAIIYGGFSRDGRLVLTTSYDTTARVWDASTGEPVTPPLRHRSQRVEHGAFSPDGRWVATAGFDSDARLWLLRSTDRPIDDLVNQAQFLAASSGAASGDLVPLAPETLRALWQTLRAKHPADFGISAEQALAWHRREAASAQTNQQSFAAMFHLDHLLAAEPANATLREQRNLASELLSTGDKEAARKLELKQLIPPRDPRARPELLDLGDHYNAALTKSWHTVEAGWDLSSLPRGVQNIGGVEFDVRGIVQLLGLGLVQEAAAPQGRYPPQVKAISVHRRVHRMHFLHAAGWVRLTSSGERLGSYVIHYADHDFTVEIPIRVERDVRDWWFKPGEKEPPGADPVWTGTNLHASQAGRNIRLFKTTWENPLPELEIESLDYVSAMTDAAPFLIAITVE